MRHVATVVVGWVEREKPRMKTKRNETGDGRLVGEGKMVAEL